MGQLLGSAPLADYLFIWFLLLWTFILIVVTYFFKNHFGSNLPVFPFPFRKMTEYIIFYVFKARVK